LTCDMTLPWARYRATWQCPGPAAPGSLTCDMTLELRPACPGRRAGAGQPVREPGRGSPFASRGGAARSRAGAGQPVREPGRGGAGGGGGRGGGGQGAAGGRVAGAGGGRGVRGGGGGRGAGGGGGAGGGRRAPGLGGAAAAVRSRAARTSNGS